MGGVDFFLGKDEVTGSIPVSSSKKKEVNRLGFTFFCVEQFESVTSDLPKTIKRGSRKRKRFREEEKAARKGYAFLKKA